MAKILITGCYGQVGSALQAQLQGSNIDVLAVDREQLDITQQSAVHKLVAAFKPNVIINAAAHTAVDKAETEQALAHAINADGPKFLAQAAESVGAAMLHISTDYVFSGDAPQSHYYTETDAVAPQGVYGQTKLDGEIEVARCCSQYIILRTAWVFAEQGNNFVKTMLKLAKERDSLGIVADQYGAPTFAEDIATTLIKIAQQFIHSGQLESGVYHYAGSPCVNWFEFAQAIFQQAQQKGVIQSIPQLKALTSSEYPTPAKRPANSKLDVSKIKNTFNIEPSDWQQALQRIEYYQ